MEVRDTDGIHNNLRTGIDIPGADGKRNPNLKRCPLCGNEALIVKYRDGYFIKCTCCECMVAGQISLVTETIIPFRDMDEAIKKWNNRKGMLSVSKFSSNSSDTAESILRKREDRADAIAEVIKKGHGEVVYVSDIVEDTGMCGATIQNNMQYAKRKYPEIKSRVGKKGYRWIDE